MFTGDGYRFDQGPSLYLLPGLFEETFGDLGSSVEKAGVELLRCPVNYDIWFSDGAKVRTSTDESVMKREIERWEGKDGFKRYLEWKAEAHQHYETSLKHVLHKNFTSFSNMFSPTFVWNGIGVHPLESIWSRTARYFFTNRLRMVFTFATMYMGMSPFDAPSTYSLLQYSELTEGIWYPRGGFQTVLRRIADIGKGLGVKYRLNAPVKKILADADGSAFRGVELEGGETIDADMVVINADLVYAYGNLFPQTAEIAKYARELRARDASCSSISFYWSLSGKVKELGVHNVFLAEEYRGSFDAIFKRQALPDDPSFYVHVPSRIDPDAAPDGCDAVIALVPVGHLLKSRTAEDGGEGGEGGKPAAEQDWPALVAKARETVLSTLTARTGCARLDELMVGEMVNTPATWEERFNLDKGAILGLGHNFSNVLSFRPRTRARGLAGAYFVGASTHPGTGVPVVLAGAKITAEQMLRDHGVKIPWEDREDNAVGKASDLDRARPPLWSSDARLSVGVLVSALALLAIAGWARS